MTKAEQKAMNNLKSIEFDLIRIKLKQQVELFEKTVQKFKTNGSRSTTTG